GSEPAAATHARSSSDPPKCGWSVSTEIATAPPRSYERAWPTGSRSSRIEPADGDRRFTSAITPTVPPPACASPRARDGGSGAAAARRASSAACGFKAAIRARVAKRIASRRVSGMLAFGRFSGTLAFRLIFGRLCAAHPPSTRDSRLHSGPYPGQRICAELRRDRPAVRLSVAGHGTRASHEPRAQRLHPARA